MHTTNEYPEHNDRSKYDLDVREHLFIFHFVDRIKHQLCIFCGVVPAPLGGCPACLEARRHKRIAEAGYDYYADFDWREL
jgi:hypothetical protein